MQFIILIGAVFYILLFIIFIIFSKWIKVSEKSKVIIFSFFVISLAWVAYSYEASNGVDLWMHFKLMNQIRNSNLKLLEFLFQTDTAVGGINYISLISFNLIRYIICKITDNNHILPMICVFVDYTIVSYILLDWSKMHKQKNKLLLLSLMLCFTFMPFLHANSGMRNALSACITALAVYLYICKKKKLLTFGVLIFVAVTIHPIALITIPLVLLSKFNLGMKGYVLILCSSFIIQNIAEIFVSTNITFLKYIGNAYYLYTSEEQYRSGRIYLWATIILIVIIIISYFVNENVAKQLYWENNEQRIYNFLCLYMFYILGNLGNYDMVLRPAYMLGPLSPVLVELLADTHLWRTKRQKYIQVLLILICMFLCCYVCWIYLSDYIKSGF